jgi:hypothetical protein
MLCAAAESVEVEHVAVLPESATAEQRTLAPSKNVTLPTLLGFPGIDVTVAVNVSESPYVLGLVPVLSATAVLVVRRAKKSFPVIPVVESAIPEYEAVPVFAYPAGSVYVTEYEPGVSPVNE